MGALTLRFQQLLITKLVEDMLAREVNLSVEDFFYTSIKRVTDTFPNIYPLFERNVRFINLEAKLGEPAADRARREDGKAEGEVWKSSKPFKDDWCTWVGQAGSRGSPYCWSQTDSKKYAPTPVVAGPATQCHSCTRTRLSDQSGGW